jgi:hypothetical protein
MNTPPTAPHDLDRFETALLSELREQVAARPVFAAGAEPPPRHRRRWATGLASAAAAATAFVVLSPGGPTASPAFAVDENAGGDVVVTVHELADADGLEAALQAHGIDAQVSFDEVGDPNRAEFSAPDFDQLPPRDDGVVPDCGSGAETATLTRDGDDWVLLIPAASPLQDQPVFMSPSASGSLKLAYASLNDPWTYCAGLS